MGKEKEKVLIELDMLKEIWNTAQSEDTFDTFVKGLGSAVRSIPISLGHLRNRGHAIRERRPMDRNQDELVILWAYETFLEPLEKCPVQNL